jgi:hypothetical protein
MPKRTGSRASHERVLSHVLYLFSAQLNDHAFAGGFHFEFRLPFGHEFAGVFDDFIHATVVVVGVMVEKDEFLHAGLERHGDGIVHATVSPANVLFEFGAVVLRVEDEDIGVAHEVNHRLVVKPRFGVGKEGDDAIGRKEPVTDADAGVVGAVGAHENGTDGEVEVLEFFDVNVAGQFVEGDGKVGAFHLAGERGDEALAGAFAAENPQAAARIVDRPEERQALDVVPVRVGEEQREIERMTFEFLEQGLAQFSQAGAGIKDDEVVAVADFDAGGVAAIAHGARSGRGDGTADAPEFYASASIDGHILA